MTLWPETPCFEGSRDRRGGAPSRRAQALSSSAFPVLSPVRTERERKRNADDNIPVILSEAWEGRTAEEVQAAMLEGDPPIYIGAGPEPRELWVAPVALQEGEEDLVARRLLAALTGR